MAHERAFLVMSASSPSGPSGPSGSSGPAASLHAVARLALLVALLFVTACCRGCSCAPPPTSAENVAGVPITLEDAKKLADPPKVKVSTRSYVPPGSSAFFKCPHIVCVVLLPYLLWRTLVPLKNTEVTVEEGGVRTLELHYDSDERLLFAVRYRDGYARRIEEVGLDKLGRRLLIERWRTPIDGAQKPTGPQERAPLGPQLDLVTPYRAALTAAPSEDARGELLHEAVTTLEEEAKPLFEIYLRAPTSDHVRAVGLGSACTVETSKACELAISLVSAEGSLTLAALSSALSRRGDRAGAEKASAAVVERYCKAEARERDGAFSLASRHAGYSTAPRDEDEGPPGGPSDAGAPSAAGATPGEGPLDRALAACPEPRRVALLLWGRRAVDRAALERALSASPEDASDVVEGMRCAAAPHREAARAMVRRHARHDAAAQKFYVHSCDAFDELDFEAAAELYARASRPEAREGLLGTFFEAARLGRATRAVAVLTKAHDAAPEAERPALSAGLVVLSILEHEKPATKGLDPNATSHWDARTQHGLIATALRFRGCTDARIQELAREAAAVRSSDRGRVCDVRARPKGSSGPDP